MHGAVNLLLHLGLIGLFIFILLTRKNKMNFTKKKLYFLSLLSTILLAIIPTIGYQVDRDWGYHYFGFPAEILVYRGGWLFSFNLLGLLFNFFLFYWFFKLILKLWKGRTKKKEI